MKIIQFLLVVLLMNTIIFPQKRVSVTAHRGASGYAPENTIASMKEAINMKADFAELDVQETADGEIVLFHDKSMKRLAGVDKEIWQLNINEIQKLEVGSWFNGKFNGEPIPKFEDVIDSINGKIKLNIELKTNGHDKQLAERTLYIVNKKNFGKNCFFTSFSYSQIKKIKELDGSIKTGLIFKTMPDSIDVFNSDFEILSVHFSLVDREFVEKAKSHGKEVHVWTVNEEEEMKRLVDLEVNSLITNYPDKARRIIDNAN